MEEPPKNQEAAKEVPPGTGLVETGQPKKDRLHDLFPVLGKYKIEDIVGNKEAVGMILQFLKQVEGDLGFAKDDLEKMRQEHEKESSDLASAKTKLGERWKSQLLLQVLTFIAAVCVTFAFSFDKGSLAFVLFVLVGMVCGLVAVIMPFVINK